LTDARIIDGTGAPGRSNQTVIVRDGLIAAVGDSQAVVVPSGAHVIDLRGKTVLPGWVMVHEHMFFSDGIKGGPAPNTSPMLYLAGGATTVRTGGSMAWGRERSLKKMIEQGELPGPDVDLTSPFIERSSLRMLQLESDYNRGRRLAEKWADQGATSFKAYQSVNAEQLRGVIDAAHERGLKVTGHLCATTYAEAAALGIDNVEHGLWGATDFVKDKRPGECPESTTIQAVYDAEWPAIRQLIQTLVSRRVVVTSTLAVFETFLPGRSPATAAALELMSPEARNRYARHRAEIDADQKRGGWIKMFEKEMAFERAFVKAGGLLIAGTDPTGHGGLVAGFSNQRQIELLVEAGFSAPRRSASRRSMGQRIWVVQTASGALLSGNKRIW
jgi:enamidase